MDKLDYFLGERKTPSVWQPCHVLEMISFLKSRGYHLNIYKELDSSRYILSNDKNVMFFGTCAKICLYFEELYFQEKEEEEKEMRESKKKREMKEDHLQKLISSDILLCSKSGVIPYPYPKNKKA